jgi:hypothetical protein
MQRYDKIQLAPNFSAIIFRNKLTFSKILTKIKIKREKEVFKRLEVEALVKDAIPPFSQKWGCWQ